MSLTSSETMSYQTSKVAALFLVKFDSKSGYKMVWSKTSSNISLDGLEYKALPSGVHEFETATVYLTHEWNGKLYYGLACFRQLDLNENEETNRDLVRMYSIGILLEPIKGKFWKPNEFGTVGWEHSDAVQETLLEFLKDEDLLRLDTLYQNLTGNGLLDLPKPNSPHALNTMLRHPLGKLSAALSAMGPLTFPIYKAALVRKRLLIFNHSSQGSGMIQEPCDRDPELCGAMAYIISLLSVIPKDVNVEPLDQHELYSQPLYNVGLQDMNTKYLEHYPGFIASTSDEILKYQKNLYDYAIVMPSTDAETCKLVASDKLDLPIRATFNDYTKFLKVYKQLPNEGENATGDDTSSIRTSNSRFSTLRFDIYGESSNIKLDHEPSWWLDEATSPMSWREYIWLAFAWFASAGTTNRATTENAFSENVEAEETRESMQKQLEQLTMIVSHFHKLTKKWFYLIDEIVCETVEDRANDLVSRVTLELTHQDIVDMELDPYSSEDIEFVREFVILYWDTVVENVEIGLGFQGLCC